MIASHRLAILFVCVGIFALGQFHRASGSVFSPILMDRFDAPASAIGSIVGVMFLATIAAQVPFGSALDRYGPRGVLTWCILLVAAGGALFALATNLETITLSRILLGIGFASMGAANHVLIARNFPARDFGYISGLVVTLGGIGGLMGTFPLAYALERLPWGAVFGAVTVLTVALALFIYVAVKPGPGPVQTEPAQGGYLTLLRLPAYRRILVMASVTFAPITTVTGLWGGPYLQSRLGLSPDVAGAVLSGLFAASILGGYIFGVLDRRWPGTQRVILGGVIISVASLALLALAPALGALPAIALLGLMVFCQQFYIPLGAHMRRAVPDAMLGRASTLMSLVAVAAIPVMQSGFGLVLDLASAAGWSEAAGYGAAFGAMGATIGLAGLVYGWRRA